MFLLTLSIFILSSCNYNNSQKTVLKEVKISDATRARIEKESQNSSKEENSEDFSNLKALGDLEIKRTVSDVKINVPSDFVNAETQEELDILAFEKGYKSATLNPDGSATFIMSKENHEKNMKETTKSINDSLNELIGSEEYPNFTKIEKNANFTKFTITTKSKELGMEERFSVIVFAMYGGMYNVFNGTPINNVYVEFINADSGDVIYSINSSDINK